MNLQKEQILLIIANLKFVAEIENNNLVIFLNFALIRSSKKFLTKYKKPISTSRILNYYSYLLLDILNIELRLSEKCFWNGINRTKSNTIRIEKIN